MPADVSRLKDRMRTIWQADESPKKTFEEALSSSRFLLEMPIRPALRAAVLRLLAELPTTGVRGRSTDPLGRPGLALELLKGRTSTMDFGEDDEVTEQYTTILDPRTGTVLAQVEAAGESTEGLPKGTVTYYTAWAPEAGWTGERPEKPRGCRLSDRPIP
jgi:hypothetical protein